MLKMGLFQSLFKQQLIKECFKEPLPNQKPPSKRLFGGPLQRAFRKPHQTRLVERLISSV
jgi:hypothetical protein